MSSGSIFVMKDIDLPDDVRSGPSTKYPFETMAVGDTFFLPDRKASKFSPYAGKFGRRTKRKFQVRDITMTKVMNGDTQTGWALAKPGDAGAVSGCAVKRLPDPTAAELAKDAAADAGNGGQPQGGDPAPAADATKADPAKAPAPAPQAKAPAGKAK